MSKQWAQQTGSGCCCTVVPSPAARLQVCSACLSEGPQEVVVLGDSASLSRALLAGKQAHICPAATLEAAVLLMAPQLPCVSPGF